MFGDLDEDNLSNNEHYENHEITKIIKAVKMKQIINVWVGADEENSGETEHGAKDK